MRTVSRVVAIILLMSPVTLSAHGNAPSAAHGGLVQDAHGSWIELVVHGDRVEVYVMDEHGNPIASSQVSGTATVMVGGQPQKTQLSPGDGNELTGTLTAPALGRLVATVSLIIGGKAATARFASS